MTGGGGGTPTGVHCALERAAAGGVEAGGGVALRQPQQLVALPELRPGQGSLEQPLGVAAHGLTELGGAPLELVGRAQRVGAELRRVVVAVGGAPAAGLARVDLEQRAAVVDAHQLRAELHLHLLPRRAELRRHRVERVLAGDVVVGMDLRRPPVGDLVGLPVPGGEQRALLLLEDLERAFAGRPVDALPRHLERPAPGGVAQLGEVAELRALEEALAHVRDAALDPRLVARLAHARGVADEAAPAGVLEEAPREARVQRVGPGHGGRKVVDHEVAGHAFEAGPGRLQTLDHRVQPLARGRPDEAVPRVAPDHDQRPDRAPPAALGVRDEAEPAEVQLRDLARRPVLHAHGHRLPATPAAAGDEAPQRAVGDLAAALGEQFMDPRDLQALGLQPALDLLRPRRQQLLARYVRPARAGAAQRRQLGELLLSRLGATWLEPGRLGRLDVAPHRHARQPRAAGDAALAESRLPAADDFPALHGQDLPVGHRCSLPGDAGDGGRTGGPGGQAPGRGGSKLLAKWLKAPGDLAIYWYIAPGDSHPMSKALEGERPRGPQHEAKSAAS